MARTSPPHPVPIVVPMHNPAFYMRPLLCAALIAITAACSAKDRDGGCSSHIVTGDGVGVVRSFMSLDSLRRTCPVLREWVDTTAEPRSRHLVSVAIGRDTAVVVIAQSSVVEIRVSAPRFRTKDAIGIGTPLRTLLAHPDVSGFAIKGRAHLQIASICGLTFRIRTPPVVPSDHVLERPALARLSPTSPVDQISAWGGCEKDTTPPRTYPITVSVDSVMLERDLDGSNVTDFVVREKRVSAEPATPGLE